MKNQPSIIYWLILGSLFFSLACNALPGLGQETPDAVPTPVALDKPTSSIEPLLSANVTDLGDRVTVAVGTELFLRSHHLSGEQLDRLDIWVNNQPLSEFPSELSQLEIISGDQIVVTDTIKPAPPTSDFTMLLRWIGRTPGTYEIKIQATDKANIPGEPVSQRIEVR